MAVKLNEWNRQPCAQVNAIRFNQAAHFRAGTVNAIQWFYSLVHANKYKQKGRQSAALVNLVFLVQRCIWGISL
jgi:hypothetical protein